MPKSWSCSKPMYKLQVLWHSAQADVCHSCWLERWGSREGSSCQTSCKKMPNALLFYHFGVIIIASKIVHTFYWKTQSPFCLLSHRSIVATALELLAAVRRSLWTTPLKLTSVLRSNLDVAEMVMSSVCELMAGWCIFLGYQHTASVTCVFRFLWLWHTSTATLVV